MNPLDLPEAYREALACYLPLRLTHLARGDGERLALGHDAEGEMGGPNRPTNHEENIVRAESSTAESLESERPGSESVPR
jgi:hypothetical protein